MIKSRLVRPAVNALLIVMLCLAPASAGLFCGSAPGKIRKAFRAPAAQATHWGIKAVSLTTGKTLIEENAGKLFIPASNVKILTAYGALKILSPQYVFPAEFSTDAVLDSATVHNLYVKGYGDPSVTVADVNLQAMALSDRIRRVTGSVVVDSSYFDPLLYGHGWMWDEGIVPYSAPISPYAVNGNCVDIFVSTGAAAGTPAQVRLFPVTAYAQVVSSAITAEYGDIQILREERPSGDYYIVTGTISVRSPEQRRRCTVSRPGLYAGTLFRDLLGRYGVRVDSGVFEAPVSTAAAPLQSFASRSLIEVLRTFVKNSDNLSGECLLKAMGAQRFGAPGDAAKGIAALQELLRGQNIGEKSYRLADGSGLSTYNELSPDLLVKILVAAWRDFSCFPELAESMSVAGKDGTLRNRMHESDGAGSLRAKTGTMSGVSCVSGYLKTRKGDLLAFSIMMNGFTGPAKPLQDLQDEVLRILYESY